MERIVLQSDNTDMIRVDGFIRTICDDNHIYNYYATISVAVTRMLDRATTYSVDSHVSSGVSLGFDFCSQGIIFSIVGSKGCFSEKDDSLNIARMLSDEVTVSDDRSKVELVFEVRGIDGHEAKRRVAILQKFYHSVPAVILQM